MSQPAPAPFNDYPSYAPRFWHGLRLGDWFSLLSRHNFRIGLEGIGLTCTVTGVATFNSVLAGVQHLVHGGAIDATEITEPPVFILGHWRSGTTLLHEFLSLDDRYVSPNTYECFAPHHCLLTETIVSNALWFLLPAQRPMDNMAAGWDRPQEDEFALCSLGQGSPILNLAFPNQEPRYLEYLDLEGLSDEELARWKEAFLFFVKLLTYRTGKGAIFKSPPHTGRIGVLHELFPTAKFVHIVRDPYAIVPSTIRLWHALSAGQGLEDPRHEHVEQFVFDCYERMYGGFFRHQHEVPAERLFEIRYEDLVRDPVTHTARLYEQLELGDFDAVRPKLEEYVASQKDYKPNKHQLDPELKSRIDRVWREYQQRYDYGRETAERS